MRVEAGREYWRGVLVAGGFTPIPRWSLDPVPGVGEHEAPIPDDVVVAARRLAYELAVPLGSVLLAAHAKVLAALSGEREVVTGYVAAAGRPPLPCRLTTEPDSWRAVLRDTRRIELDLLSHQEFPVDDLRRELDLTGPSFETVFDPTGDGGDLREDTVLRVGVSHAGDRLVLRLRYRTDALDADARGRIAGYHLTALALMAADPDAEHGRASLLSDEELRFQLDGLAGPRRELPDRRLHELFEERVRMHPDAIASGAPATGSGPTGSSTRTGQPAWAGAAGARAAPRGRGRGGDRAQPGLDGRRPGDLQGRRGVSAHRAALPSGPHRDHAVACRGEPRADRTRQHRHARRGPRLDLRSAADLRRRGLRGGRRRGRSRYRRSRRTSSPTSLHLGLHGEPKGAMCEHAGHAQPPLREDHRPEDRRGAGDRAGRAAVLRHLVWQLVARCWSAGGPCSSSKR